MTENGQITSGPRYDVAYFLGDQHRMEMLLGDSTKDPFLSKAKKSFQGYSTDQLTELTGILLTNIGRDTNIWNEKRRRAAIQLLTVVPIGSEKMDREVLLRQYSAVLERQDESEDPSGSISSLLDAGILIARFFPLIDGKNEMIEKALEKTLEKYNGKPGADIITKKSGEIKRKLKKQGSKTTESSTDEESIYSTAEEIKPLTDRLPPTQPKRRPGASSKVREQSKPSKKPTSEEILTLLRSSQSNADLTQRQLTVLALIHEQRMSYKQIARMLGLGNSDVDRINRQALRVMGIQIDE